LSEQSIGLRNFFKIACHRSKWLGCRLLFLPADLIYYFFQTQNQFYLNILLINIRTIAQIVDKFQIFSKVFFSVSENERDVLDFSREV